jgi:hypothetical protein
MKQLPKTTFIYGLYDINDPLEKIRYVGKANNIKNRLYHHRTEYKESNSRKNIWVAGLIACYTNVGIKILEEVNYNIWGEREAYWQDQFNDLLCDPTKIGLGGGVYSTRGNPNPNYNLTYDECKEAIKHLNVRKIKDWKKICENNLVPHNIPRAPKEFYENKGWISWSDFMGHQVKSAIELQMERISLRISYNDAKTLIKSHFVKNRKQYKKLRQYYPEFKILLPARPDLSYKEWIDYENFCDYKREKGRLIADDWKNFLLNINKILEYVDFKYLISSVLKLHSKEDYFNIQKQYTILLPVEPDNHYDEWESWDEILYKNPLSK